MLLASRTICSNWIISTAARYHVRDAILLFLLSEAAESAVKSKPAFKFALCNCLIDDINFIHNRLSKEK